MKLHLRTKLRTLQIMNKEYALVAKEIEKEFKKVFPDRHMYPPTTPTIQVPYKEEKASEVPNAPIIGP